MNDKLKNSLASLEMEGFTFTKEQKEFMIWLTESVDRGEITWDEAIKMVKVRHENDKNSDNQPISP